jgi:hypothetical protein
MPLDIQMLENQALNLNFNARVRLAEKLIMSLDTSSEKNNLQFWIMEAEKRLKALREGKAVEIAAEEAFRQARAAIL